LINPSFKLCKNNNNLQIQRDIATTLSPFFGSDGLVKRCLDHAAGLEHIMDFTRLRALGSLFSMINQSVRNVQQYNHSHSDFPMSIDQVKMALLNKN